MMQTKCTNFLPAALNGMCTYIMPTVVFFFVRQTQSPELARTYLSIRQEFIYKQLNLKFVIP
jgi:hypothetical protein